jgi:hypothetical protein
MVEDVAGGDGGHPRGAGGGGQSVEPVGVVGAEAAGQRAGRAGAEQALEAREVVRKRRSRLLGEQNCKKPLLPLFEIAPCQAATALATPGLAQAEQAAEPAVGGAVGGVDEQRRRQIVEVEPAADDEAHARDLRRLMRADHSGQRAVIGDAERRDAEQARCGKQLLRARCAAQEREMRRDLKLRRAHGELHRFRPRSDAMRPADARRPAVVGATRNESSRVSVMPRRARAATSARSPASGRRGTARSARPLPSRPGNSRG